MGLAKRLPAWHANGSCPLPLQGSARKKGFSHYVGELPVEFDTGIFFAGVPDSQPEHHLVDAVIPHLHPNSAEIQARLLDVMWNSVDTTKIINDHAPVLAEGKVAGVRVCVQEARIKDLVCLNIGEQVAEVVPVFLCVWCRKKGYLHNGALEFSKGRDRKPSSPNP